MEIEKYEVPADKLRWECDPKIFRFKCTKNLAPLEERWHLSRRQYQLPG